MGYGSDPNEKGFNAVSKAFKGDRRLNTTCVCVARTLTRKSRSPS